MWTSRKSLFLFTVLLAAAPVRAQAAARTLVVVSLQKEAAMFKGPQFVTVVGAGRPDILRSRLDAIHNHDITLVVSFGIARGLNPNLKPGQLVVGAALTDGRTTTQVEPKLVKSFAGMFHNLKPLNGLVLSRDNSDDLTSAARARLRSKTGADVFDSDSEVVFEFAKRQHIAFGIVRAVSVPSSMNLPPAAQIPLLPDSKADMRAIGLSLRRHPFQFPALITLNGYFQAAMKTLKKAADALGDQQVMLSEVRTR